MIETVEKNCVMCNKIFNAKLYIHKKNYITGKEEKIYYHFCFKCFQEWDEKNQTQKGKCLIDSDSDED